MKKTLFIVSRSPWKALEVKTIADFAVTGDAVVFIQEGVYYSGTLPKGIDEYIQSLRQRDVKMYFLEPDLMARGLKEQENSVDYDGFLDLIEKYENIFH